MVVAALAEVARAADHLEAAVAAKVAAVEVLRAAVKAALAAAPPVKVAAQAQEVRPAVAAVLPAEALAADNRDFMRVNR